MKSDVEVDRFSFHNLLGTLIALITRSFYRTFIRRSRTVFRWWSSSLIQFMQRVLANEVSVHSEGCRWMSFSRIGCVESGEKIYTYFFMYWHVPHCRTNSIDAAPMVKTNVSGTIRSSFRLSSFVLSTRLLSKLLAGRKDIFISCCTCFDVTLFVSYSHLRTSKSTI